MLALRQSGCQGLPVREEDALSTLLAADASFWYFWPSKTLLVVRHGIASIAMPDMTILLTRARPCTGECQPLSLIGSHHSTHSWTLCAFNNFIYLYSGHSQATLRLERFADGLRTDQIS